MWGIEYHDDFATSVQQTNDNGYIVVPNGTGLVSEASDSTDGQVQISFSLSQSANVEFDAVVDFANVNDDSFYYKMDSGSWSTQNNELDSNLSVATFSNLSAGNHTLTILRREDGAKLDKLWITNSGGDLSGEGSAAGNCSISVQSL